MVTVNELEGFRRDRYFARAWALLTRDRGWIKPVLVMTVALLVPFVGWLGVMGYVLEWARLTAWGVNSAPKQRGVAVGSCIASGWRAFVVLLVWGICEGLIASVLAALPLVDGLLSFAWTIFGIFLTLVVMVAMLRATIYQKIKAGLRLPTIWKMASHDVAGLMRILGILVLGALVIGMVSAIVTVVVLMNILPQLIYLVDYVMSYEPIISDAMIAGIVVPRLVMIVLSQWPALVVVMLVGGFLGVLVSMLAYTALGLWMRQFNVAAWSREEDPLPPYLADPRDVDSACWQDPSTSVPPTPGAPGTSPSDGQESASVAQVVEVTPLAVSPDAPASQGEPAPEPVQEPSQAAVEPVAETVEEPPMQPGGEGAEDPVSPECPANPERPACSEDPEDPDASANPEGLNS